MKKLQLGAIVVVASSLVAAAGSAAGATAAGAATSPQVTLIMAADGPNPYFTNLVNGFEKLHPNVKIEIQNSTYTDYTASIYLRLASSNSPDLAYIAAMTPNYVEDHLLVNLNQYAAKYGWAHAVPAYALDEYRMSPDLVSGSGSLWAVSGGLSLTGVYYNKQLGASLGITSPPVTLAQLTSDMAKAKAKGVVGLEVGADGGYAAFSIQQVAADYGPLAPINNWIFGVKGSTFDEPYIAKAAGIVQGWARAGYLNADYSATDLTQAVAAFNAGKALFINDGNWDATLYAKALGSRVAFIPFPAATQGGKVASLVGGTAGFGISAKSKHSAIAVEFLNYTISRQAAQEILAAGDLPYNVSGVKPANSVLQGVVKTWAAVEAADGSMGYWANAFATANTTLIQTTEELLGNKITVPSFVSAVQSAWAQANASA